MEERRKVGMKYVARWLLAGLLVSLAGPVLAGSSTGAYMFKHDVALAIEATIESGLTLDSVLFKSSKNGPVSFFRSGEILKAEVKISNLTEKGRMVGVVIALFDEKGNLVGVASGGNKLLPLKDSRQRTYTLLFDHVNGLVDTATTFKITVETR
jgi:hypothetical protein